MAAGRSRTSGDRAVTQEGETPDLAGVAGVYREYRPAPGLARHFRCAWDHAVPGGQQRPIMVVPDGCVDLLWTDGRLMIAGPDLTAVSEPLKGGAVVSGMRFQPGAAFRWLGLPMSELVGRRVELSELWGPRAAALADTLDGAETSADRLMRMQETLAGIAGTIDTPAPEISFVFRSLERSAEPAGVARLLDRLALSDRTLRRRCHDAFGYGPKTLDRILRFQRFLAISRGQRQVGLAGSAHDAGYADQSHLARDVRDLTGLTPSAILRQIAACLAVSFKTPDGCEGMVGSDEIRVTRLAGASGQPNQRSEEHAHGQAGQRPPHRLRRVRGRGHRAAEGLLRGGIRLDLHGLRAELL
ncbi:helix-turn-helix domain-containing protein [Thalassobaculum sp.]|uniref:AraC family transcriptional regulator n=1 Tax=Thalassobaculum sp. TaxID=2022740 RepID=UPI0032F04241